MRAGSFTRSSQELFALEKGVCLKKKTLVYKKRRPDLETLTLLLFAPVHSIYVQGGSWSTEKQKLP